MDENMQVQKMSFEQFRQTSLYEMVKEPESILTLLELMWNIPFRKMFSYDYKNKEEEWERKTNPQLQIYREFAGRKKLIPCNYPAFMELSFGEVLTILDEDLRRMPSDDTFGIRNVLCEFAGMYQYFHDFHDFMA